MKWNIALSILSLFSGASEVIQTIQKEPLAVLKSAYLITTQGVVGAFDYKGANPSEIDEKSLDLPVVICLQGDHSNPATFVPLIDVIKSDERTRDMALFVPNFPYNRDEDLTGDLTNLIDSIKAKFDKHQKPLKVIFVGHSMGGIVSTFYTYCLEKKAPDVEVKAVIAISSRFGSIGSNEEALNPMLTSIENRLTNGKLGVPLYSVFGDEDWLIPRQALEVGSEKAIFIAHKQGHLSTLYDKDAIQFVQEAVASQM